MICKIFIIILEQLSEVSKWCRYIFLFEEIPWKAILCFPINNKILSKHLCLSFIHSFSIFSSSFTKAWFQNCRCMFSPSIICAFFFQSCKFLWRIFNLFVIIKNYLFVLSLNWRARWSINETFKFRTQIGICVQPKKKQWIDLKAKHYLDDGSPALRPMYRRASLSLL